MTMQECYKAIGGNCEGCFWDAFTTKQCAHIERGCVRIFPLTVCMRVSNELTELLRDRTGEKPGIPESMEKVTEA